VAASATDPSLPRSLRVVGIPIAGLLLFCFFLYLGFPFDPLGRRIASEVQRSNGVRIEFRQLDPRLYWLGPGIEASAVRATLPDGTVYAFERVGLRPAWSLAWLRGDPAVVLDLSSAFGDAKGTLVLGSLGGFDGDLASLAVGRLPLESLTDLALLDGLLDAKVDVRMNEEGPVGDATFTARDGSLAIARFPVEIPFATLEGKLRFGGDAFVTVERFAFEGPMVNGTVTGSIQRAPRFAQAPVRLEADLEAKANVRGAMQGAGIRFDRGGMAKMRITGTVSNPNVR